MKYDQFTQPIKSNVVDGVRYDDPVEIGYSNNANNPHKNLPIVDTLDEQCYAKIVRTERENGIHCRYFIKSDLNRHPINPWDEAEIQRNKRLASSIGRDAYKFLEISQIGFDMYMLFLRGNSVAHLDKARREMINV